MITGYQLRFRFRHVKGQAVGLRNSAHIKTKETHDLGKDMPARQKSPIGSCLRIHNGSQTQAAGHQQHAYHREADGQLVTNHLGGAAQAAQQGVLAVGGPSGQGDSINRHGTDGKQEQQANVRVGHLKRVHTAQGKRRAEGNDCKGQQGKHQ